MKVLAVNKFYHVYGGADRYFFELGNVLERHGHTVVPFAMQDSANFESPYSKHFVSHVEMFEAASVREKLRAAGRILYSREARRSIKRLASEVRPQIAHMHLVYHHLSPSIVPALRDAGVPIVHTLHDYKPICPAYTMVSNGAICEACKGRRFYSCAVQRCNRGSLAASVLNSIEMYFHYAMGWYTDMIDRYVCPSDFMRRKMIEFGFPAAQVEHVPNFVDPARYTFEPTDRGYFAYVGRLVSTKGVATLVKAMSRVRGADLLVVGEGPERATLEPSAPANVKFLGYKSGKELEDLIGGAMFTILPSEWYENCPMSILESMARGKPVIGARIGGIPELVHHEETGLLFTSRDADDLAHCLQDLIDHPDKRRRFGAAARDRIVREYGPETHYERIMAIYADVIAKRTAVAA
jgi:glycosyltransferase involved in cell wall biosynthesis